MYAEGPPDGGEKAEVHQLPLATQAAYAEGPSSWAGGTWFNRNLILYAEGPFDLLLVECV